MELYLNARKWFLATLWRAPLFLIALVGMKLIAQVILDQSAIGWSGGSVLIALNVLALFCLSSIILPSMILAICGKEFSQVADIAMKWSYLVFILTSILLALGHGVPSIAILIVLCNEIVYSLVNY